VAPQESRPVFIDRLGRIVLGAAALGVFLLAAWALMPLFAPLMFAVWFAAILRPFSDRVTRVAGGRASVGAGASVALVIVLLIPFALVISSLVTSVIAFVRQLLASSEVQLALEKLVSSNAAEPQSEPAVRWFDLARNHGMTAWDTLSGLAGAGAWALIVLLVFFVSLFEFLAYGKTMWAWAVDHVPLTPTVIDRLARAFMETGRGLIVGAGLTALAQALVAVLGYALLGVPRALILGAITFICAFVPAIGTAVVWAPVAAGLALRGDTTKAVILVVIGIFGVGMVDNIVRPFFQRWGGRLQLPAFLLLLAAFGGLSAFGAMGLIIGPLALRIASELLAIAKEARDVRPFVEG